MCSSPVCVARSELAGAHAAREVCYQGREQGHEETREQRWKTATEHYSASHHGAAAAACLLHACVHTSCLPPEQSCMLALTSRSICRMGASAPPSTKVSSASDSLQWRVSWAWCWSPCTQASGGPDAAGASPLPEWGMPSVERVQHTAPTCALEPASALLSQRDSLLRQLGVAGRDCH